jgi:hypothetical protein
VKSKFIGAFGTLAAVMLWAAPVSPSHATNINYGTNQCQLAFFASAQYAPQHAVDGVMNGGDSQNFHVVCGLPRSPLPAGSSVAAFYVDGDNFNGAITVCTVASYDYTGTFLGSYAFDASEAHYDRYVTLPAAQVPYYAYTYLICTLPANGNGVLRGVTSLQ